MFTVRNIVLYVAQPFILFYKSQSSIEVDIRNDVSVVIRFRDGNLIVQFFLFDLFISFGCLLFFVIRIFGFSTIANHDHTDGYGKYPTANHAQHHILLEEFLRELKYFQIRVSSNFEFEKKSYLKLMQRLSNGCFDIFRRFG